MKKHSIFWIVILFGSGGLLLLNALGIGKEYALVPMIGSLLLLAISVASIIELNFVTGLLPLSLIAYLWKDQIGLPDMNIWMLLLAALLLGIGLTILFWRVRKKTGRCCGKNIEWKAGSAVTSTDEDEYVEVDSNFGEHIKYVRSTNLKKVKIDSNFSSIKVYFDQCQASPEGATIYVDCNFSGIELYVPRTWNIDNQTHVFAGSVDGASQASGDYTKIMLIGDVNFGSVKVNYL